MQRIARYSASDGQKRLDLFERQDGYFQFVEDTLRSDDHPIEPSMVWIPSIESGLYASRDEAEADARATVSWLKG
ncbi:MAG: hypothetical protein KIT02_13315 [Devosia sp.]|uniref:hypothetical protein n=1 Tax=Devosia sp. TaxID=1871048 RepID=UPI0024CA4490|nr:hypothetical protein [Devosia sp.]UYN98903.1 MAG: hypothetical protein KIT02_13315 [Devosia sp.]